MISRTECRGNAKLSVNSLHNLAGKLGASVGDHLVPKTITSEGPFQQYVHGAIYVNSLAIWGYNYALCEPVNHTVDGIVIFTFWEVGNEVGCDGAKGMFEDLVRNERDMGGMVAGFCHLTGSAAVDIISNKD